MVEIWKERGMPLAHNKPSRFKKWVQEIGGILAANGIDGFLENFEEASSSYDLEASEVGRLFSLVPNKIMESSSLVNLCEEEGIFEDIFAMKRPETALSQRLKSYIGKKVPFPDDTFAVIELGPQNRSKKVLTFIARPTTLKDSESPGNPGTTSGPKQPHGEKKSDMGESPRFIRTSYVPSITTCFYLR